MQEMWVQFLGQEDPLQEKMAICSSIVAWKIPWTEEPGRLQSMGSQESDTTEPARDFGEKNIPGKKTSKCKDPEAGVEPGTIGEQQGAMEPGGRTKWDVETDQTDGRSQTTKQLLLRGLGGF